MSKLTVFFNDPFWIGVFEIVENGKTKVCRVVFGKEPKDYDIYEFILKRYDKLKFSRSVQIDKKTEIRVNPKRMQRKIQKSLQKNSIGTKAQQAIKLDYESKKVERKILSRERREEQEELKLEKKHEKKKQKKRGH